MRAYDRLREAFDARVDLLAGIEVLADRLRHEDLLGDVWAPELVDWESATAEEKADWMDLAEAMLS